MIRKILFQCLLASSLVAGGSAFAAHKSTAKKETPAAETSATDGPVRFAPVVTSGSVGNWSYRCVFKGDSLSAGPQNCLIQQELAVQQKGQRPVPLGMVVLARAPQSANQASLADRPWHIAIVAPAGLSLQKQPQISTDQNAPVALSWESCANSGCISSADLTTSQAKEFHLASSGSFVASRLEGTNDLKISFSLKGLDKAMDRVQSWIDHPPFH
ncbi:invasion associated locus B family protein [Acetobacteraceae bacterium ESL0709]|nr:invasion associated locus B family protein [Acetobacteraceae bacterium ESL0697]MDF7678916.1 invasion associated locus B family protein [Acetobacteraceae bacterium ESL0709]